MMLREERLAKLPEAIQYDLIGLDDQIIDKLLDLWETADNIVKAAILAFHESNGPEQN